MALPPLRKMIEGEPLAFGLTGPELVVGGIIAVGAYYIAKKAFRALNGEQTR